MTLSLGSFGSQVLLRHATILVPVYDALRVLKKLRVNKLSGLGLECQGFGFMSFRRLQTQQSI